jgi:hypothetical protein
MEMGAEVQAGGHGHVQLPALHVPWLWMSLKVSEKRLERL